MGDSPLDEEISHGGQKEEHQTNQEACKKGREESSDEGGHETCGRQAQQPPRGKGHSASSAHRSTPLSQTGQRHPPATADRSTQRSQRGERHSASPTHRST